METTIESSRKQMKLSTDRLRALPDGVVSHIFSFLPTKLSVSTSILARRWRYQWTHAPNLDFDDTNHKSKNLEKYSDIINRVMLLHKGQIINFRLNSIEFFSDYQFETWIVTAIARKVKELDLFLSFQVKLPQCLFTCKTLTDLTLQACNDIPTSGTVYLPKLKKLRLFFLKCKVDESVSRFLSGCPLLEELLIDHISVENGDSGCWNISTPTLKRLTVNIPPHNVYISVPALKYLRMGDFFSFKRFTISPVTIASLIEVDICLYGTPEFDEGHPTPCNVVNLLNWLCNLKCLQLTGLYNDKLLDIGGVGSIVKFDNLTKLELRMVTDWRFLVKILEIADNLEVLTVSGVSNWMEPKQVSRCLLSRLRNIRIDGTVYTEHKISMVRYLLRNAKVMKKMDIILPDDDDGALKEKSDVVQRISLFESGSKACRIVFLQKLMHL